jgi:hypothetical protein
MSYFVSLYAEWRNKGEQEWKLVGKDSITDDFKLFMVGNPGDWTESDRFNSFDPVDPKTLSSEMKVFCPKCENSPERFRQLDIVLYEARLDEIIKNHRERIKTTLVALGMNAHFDDYGNLDVNDDWRIDDECTAKMRENRKDSQLTFPVNKELINDIVMEDSAYARALKNKGIMEAIYGMIPFYDNDLIEIRLIAVN